MENIKNKEELKSKKQKKYIIIISTIFIILIILIGSYFILTPKIDLKGKKETILEYPNKYKEPGFDAKIIGKDANSKVKITGKVNNKKIGEYKITYEIKNLFLTKKITRTVKVIDKEKPNLTLNDVVEEGLRYDLTVPLARFYANNKEKLPNVFKSIQVDYSFRAERPQRGRDRQFVQCDVDIFGDDSINAKLL